MKFTHKVILALFFIISILLFSSCENATPPEFGSNQNRDYTWEVIPLQNPEYPEYNLYCSFPFLVLGKNEIYMRYVASQTEFGFGYFNGKNFTFDEVMKGTSVRIAFNFGDKFIISEDDNSLVSYTPGNQPQFYFHDNINNTRFAYFDAYLNSFYLGGTYSPESAHSGFKIIKIKKNEYKMFYQNEFDDGRISKFVIEDNNSFYYLMDKSYSLGHNSTTLVYVKNGNELPLNDFPFAYFSKINNKNYLSTSNGELYKLESGKVELLHTFPNGARSILGRSEDDIIYSLDNKIFHFNGINSKEIYQFEENISVSTTQMFDDWILVVYRQIEEQKFKILRGYLN